MGLNRKQRRNLFLGLGFLGPNILGFLAFTIIPLFFSLSLAFTNWDLRLHNMFKDEPLKFVGLENFTRLLGHPDFWRFLGNTLFLMMGVPFAIAGSLLLALLLSKDLSGGSRRVFGILVAAAGLTGSITMLCVVGAGAMGMTILLCGLVFGILLLGTLGGSTVYRTLFYLPYFTSGVAVYILWKKLYNPQTGPINNFLTPILDSLGHTINATPSWVVSSGYWVCLGLIAVLLCFGVLRLVRWWRDGEWSWGTALLFVIVVGAGAATLYGIGVVFHRLPAMAAHGLTPPEWLTDYQWAKPAIMIMAFWGAIGSNNMLLYLAGLSNVPVELYEAADIDGASAFQKFWNVTWPQLAPITFFIVIMSVIAGLQGGFEMARTMTNGGPAGATTTLSYFIYTEGFETGRLGYSSAVAWTLFVMVFTITMFNWKFGSRYVND